MPIPQPAVRPGAQRRPSGPASTAGPARSGPSLEDLRALPATVDDGADATLDPDLASSGKMQDETATIAGAKFAIQDWKRKDGSYPENAFPEVQLQVSYKRDGDDAEDRPYTEGYRYGNVGMFAPTKDGNTVKVRPGVVKDGGYVPAPRKTEPAMLFLSSLQNAGGKNVIEKLKAEGVKSLIGLRVRVRSRKEPGQNEKARPVLLVDFIEGVKPVTAATPAPAQAAAPAVQAAVPAAPVVTPAVVAATQSDTAIDSLAEAALLDILADGNAIPRSQIPTTLIRLDKWKSHEHRGAILKTLRDDAFINNADRKDVLWTVDGANIKKA